MLRLLQPLPHRDYGPNEDMNLFWGVSRSLLFTKVLWGKKTAKVETSDYSWKEVFSLLPAYLTIEKPLPGNTQVRHPGPSRAEPQAERVTELPLCVLNRLCWGPASAFLHPDRYTWTLTLSPAGDIERQAPSLSLIDALP